MKISGCKNCGTRFNGFRCPECGRPLVITNVFFVFVPMIVAFVVLRAMIPDEAAPRVSHLGHGVTEYCFQSLNPAIGVPVCLLAFITLLILNPILLRQKSILRSDLLWVSDWPRGIRWVLVGLGTAVLVCVLSLLAWLLLAVVLIRPLTRFRVVAVDPHQIELQTLWRSWSFPRQGIARAEVIREEIFLKGGRKEIDTCFVVEDKEGNVYNSVNVRLDPADPQFKVHSAVFDKLELHLSEK